MGCKIMAWNIRHGGGSRVAEIIEVIRHHAPDVLVLTEFRHNAVAPQITAALLDDGLKFQAALNGPARELSVLIASRFPFTGATLENELPAWPFRAIRADFDQFTLFGFYVPTGERKRPVLHFMRDLAEPYLDRPTLLIGDFNTGIPHVDERGAELTCSAEFAEVLARGWIDLYRVRYPDSRERSFYERPWLGYRIDHALSSPSFNEAVREVFYSHDERYAGISDHSSLHVAVDVESLARAQEERSRVASRVTLSSRSV